MILAGNNVGNFEPVLQVWRTEDGYDCAVARGVAAPVTGDSFVSSKSSAVECSRIKGRSIMFVSPVLPHVIPLTGFSSVYPEHSCVYISIIYMYV